MGGAFGRYEITEEIGRGAMGVVYRARDPMIHRDVAVKVVNQSYLEYIGVKAEEYFQRFRREAEVAGRLNHPAIVKIYDLGPNYIVMEFVEGRSLSASIATLAGRPLSAALDIVGQVAAALDHAHSQGVVHRDIKPANIMLRPDGTVKVMDFGLARVESSTLTAAGEILGSAPYMAPEAVLGQPATARSDVFSLGVVAYELMTGQRPFGGASVSAIIHSIVREQPQAPHNVELNLPPDYDAIFERVLCKEPAGRHASAGEFAQALVLKRWADKDPLIAGSMPNTAEDAPTRLNVGAASDPESAAQLPPEDATLVLAEDMSLGDSDQAAHTPTSPAASLPTPSSSVPAAVPGRTPSARRRIVLGLAGAVLIVVAAFLVSILAERRPPAEAPLSDASPALASPVQSAAAPGASEALPAASPAAQAGEAGEEPPPPSGAPVQANAALAALSVSSEPPGANVVVGGKLLGATPLRANVPAGRMTVLVLKAGYEPWSHELALEAGAVHALSARLASRASAAPEPIPSVSAPPPPPVLKEGDLVALSDEVTPPRRISGSGPSVSASQVGRSPGSVVVEFVVDESGAVASPRIVESAGLALDKACLEAVERWRYEPAVTQGVRVKVVQRATFRFERR